jgi:hypothetical protein
MTNKCHICGKSTPTSQGLAGHMWFKHGGKTGQERVLVQGAAAQQAQAAQSQGLGSPVMVQVPASYLARLQQQAQQAQLAQPQQGQGTTMEDSKRTVTVSPSVMVAFDSVRKLGYEGNLEDLITEMVLYVFSQSPRVRFFTPA